MGSNSIGAASNALKGFSWFRQLDTLSRRHGDNAIRGFRDHYFAPERPVVLSHGHFNTITGAKRWFKGGQLNYEYLEQYDECMVPIEMTRSIKEDGNGHAMPAFTRNYMPLYMFLQWMRSHPSERNGFSLYLAQCQLLDLPPALRADFDPAPELVTQSGKGDIYDTNIWLGLPATYTPLHRDPNPNIFVQLAGSKVVRLCEPTVGFAIFKNVRSAVNKYDNSCRIKNSAVFRGEEMMYGPERDLLESVVWDDEASGQSNQSEGPEGYEVTLNAGDGLFIPTGWWHSLKSVGDTVSGSVNWWFR